MGFSLQDYTNIEKIGEGGQGKVYRAVQISLKRKVAIKEMAGGLVESEDQHLWLQEETALAASIEHDNIVRIYDFGYDNGCFYLVMEYIEGLDLARLLTLEKFPKEIGLMIMLLALRGLRYAHSKDIIHCDFKPNNILVSRTGRVIVTDFGMTHPGTESTRILTRGKLFLTPAFMPPEVAMGIEGYENVKELFSETSPVSAAAGAAERIKRPDARRDIWSAGVVLFRIISGKYPFIGENIPELISSIQHTKVPSIENIAPSLPADLASAIGRCLQKNPDKRLAKLDPLIEPLEKLFLDMNISDYGKEICAFFADAGTVARRIEKWLLIYHNRKWRECKKSGDTAKAAAHFQEAERYASVVLSSAGIAPGPSNPPAPVRRARRKSQALFALTAAAVTVVTAAIILFAASGVFFKNSSRPVPPTAAAAPEQTPVHQQQSVTMTEPAPAADSGVRINDTVPPQFTKGQPNTVMTAIPPAGPAARQTTAGGPPQKYGLLNISITPAEAQVFADEKPFSTKEADSTQPLKTGSHFIVATADGYEPYWSSLEIAANKTSTISIRLSPVPENHGYLQVIVSSPSSVYIDGVFRGTTQTLQTIALKAGEHHVKLRSKGYRPFDKSVVIDGGSTAVVEATLVSATK
jgi:serine/threonine protein kinase